MEFDLYWTSKDGTKRFETMTYGSPSEYVRSLNSIGASDIKVLINGVEIDYNLPTDFQDKVSGF